MRAQLLTLRAAMADDSTPERKRPDVPPAAQQPKSFGNISEQHWTRARAGQNEEALAYYRERSHAPGVEEGGGARNHYCMECDGVIDFDQALTHCPHCAAPLEGMSKRYFNWVEINEPAKSDLIALLPIAGVIALVVIGLLCAFYWLRS